MVCRWLWKSNIRFLVYFSLELISPIPLVSICYFLFLSLWLCLQHHSTWKVLKNRTKQTKQFLYQFSLLFMPLRSQLVSWPPFQTKLSRHFSILSDILRAEDGHPTFWPSCVEFQSLEFYSLSKSWARECYSFSSSSISLSTRTSLREK